MCALLKMASDITVVITSVYLLKCLDKQSHPKALYNKIINAKRYTKRKIFHILKDDLKKCVFRTDINIARNIAHITLSKYLFDTLGPATLNTQAPLDFSLVIGTCNSI